MRMTRAKRFGFCEVAQGHYLLVESARAAHNHGMRHDPEPTPPRRTWHALLAPLRVCCCCGALLNSTTARADTFCRECLERSRDVSDDQLGGEA